MFFFLPTVLQPVLGIVVLAAGLAMHKVVFDVVGAVILVVGCARVLMKRRNGGAGGAGR